MTHFSSFELKSEETAATIVDSLASYREFLRGRPLAELHRRAKQAEQGGRRWMAGLIRQVIEQHPVEVGVSSN